MCKRLGPVSFSALGTHYYYYKSLLVSSPSLSQSLHIFTQSLLFSSTSLSQSLHPVPSPNLSQSLHLFTQSLPVSSNLHPVSPILFNQSLSVSSPTTSTRDNRAADSQPLTWRRVAPIPTRTEPGKKTEKEIGSALILSVCTAQKERRKPPGCKQNKLTNQHIKQVDLLTLPGSATLPAITAAAGLSERGRQLRPVQSRQSAA